MQLCSAELCGCMETDEEGIFGRHLFQAVYCRCYRILIYSIITQRWIVYLLRAQTRRDLTARSLGTYMTCIFQHSAVETGLEDTRPGRVSGRQHARWLLVGLAQTRRDLIARSLGT
jgi:hypothetical protein